MCKDSRTSPLPPPGLERESQVELHGKRILIVVPPRRFQDEEYASCRSLFDASGASVAVASLSRGPATGMSGSVVYPDLSLEEVRAKDFDGILLIGGTGSSAFWHHETVHGLLKEMVRSGDTVGAICLAPVTLANAGLLEGKTATSYPSAAGLLSWKGAIYTGSLVEISGNIVTAKGPEAAEAFACAVAQAMAGQQ